MTNVCWGRLNKSSRATRGPCCRETVVTLASCYMEIVFSERRVIRGLTVILQHLFAKHSWTTDLWERLSCRSISTNLLRRLRDSHWWLALDKIQDRRRATTIAPQKYGSNTVLFALDTSRLLAFSLTARLSCPRINVRRLRLRCE